MSRPEHSDYLHRLLSLSGAALFFCKTFLFSFYFPMLRILVSVATYIGILNTIITILYSHRQGRNTRDSLCHLLSAAPQQLSSAQLCPLFNCHLFSAL